MYTEEEIRSAKGREYWIRRYARHHIKTVGTSNRRIGEQDSEYETKRKFILPKVPRDVKTLEFGCGIGRYAPYFTQYLGYDFVLHAVKLARLRNPSSVFTSDLEKAKEFNAEMVLFATVLQHVPKGKMGEIVDIFKDVGTIVVYENTSVRPNKNYIWFRSVVYYFNLFSGYFSRHKIYHHDVSTYNATGRSQVEQHSLIVFKK